MANATYGIWVGETDKRVRMRPATIREKWDLPYIAVQVPVNMDSFYISRLRVNNINPDIGARNKTKNWKRIGEEMRAIGATDAKIYNHWRDWRIDQLKRENLA